MRVRGLRIGVVSFAALAAACDRTPVGQHSGPGTAGTGAGARDGGAGGGGSTGGAVADAGPDMALGCLLIDLECNPPCPNGKIPSPDGCPSCQCKPCPDGTGTVCDQSTPPKCTCEA